MTATEFILLVEQYPCLYNSFLPDYARKDTTDKAWQEVADELGWTVTECKEKWKNIRNGFVRSLKPSQNGSLKKPYYLYDAMQFVVPYINPSINIQLDQRRPNTSNINNETIDASSEDDQPLVKQEPVEIEVDPIDPLKSRRTHSKRALRKLRGPEMTNHLISKRMRPEDPKKMFLLSLLPDVRNLTDRQLSVFRIKVLMLLEDVRSRSGSELREMLRH